MDAYQLPLHVFLSYAREDEAAVAEFRRGFDAASVSLWIDTANLVPGTPNWETAIRTAIRSSHCIVLFCSPHARQSSFVQAELELARHHKIPIVPAWIDGDNWIESVPLPLSQTQYLDLRKRHDPQAITVLQKQVSLIIAKNMPKHAVIDDCFAGWYDGSLRYHASGYPSYVSIILDEGPSSRKPPEKQRKEQMAVFDPQAYSSTQQILDDLFMAYLSGRVKPLTYGNNWILRGRSRKQHGINPDRIVAPWSYLEYGWTRPLAEYDFDWAMESPRKYDLVAGSVWQILWSDGSSTIPYLQPLGLAVSSDELFDAVMIGDGKQPALLERAGYLEAAEFAAVDPARYRHAIVIENKFGGDARILKETAKKFSKKTYNPRL